MRGLGRRCLTGAPGAGSKSSFLILSVLLVGLIFVSKNHMHKNYKYTRRGIMRELDSRCSGICIQMFKPGDDIEIAEALKAVAGVPKHFGHDTGRFVFAFKDENMPRYVCCIEVRQHSDKRFSIIGGVNIDKTCEFKGTLLPLLKRHVKLYQKTGLKLTSIEYCKFVERPRGTESPVD
jgi:hypothetical protein